MTTRTTTFNPLRLNDMLGDSAPASAKMRGRDVTWSRGYERRLRRSPPCAPIADRLENCTTAQPCGSGACPACGRATQRLIADAVRSVLRERHEDGTTVCVSIVPADGAIRPGGLDPVDCARAIRRWKERLGKAGFTWFVGAADFSFNVHESGRYGPHWLIHFHGVTVTDGPKAPQRRLRKYFPKADVIPVPVKIKPWDGRKKALRYIVKPNFWMRIGRDDVERQNAKKGGKRKSRDTDKQRLPSERKRELLICLDALGVKGRLIFTDCQLIARRGKRPRIVLRSPVKRDHGKA